MARLDLGPARSGRGLLAVRGDLLLHDGFRWEGTLLVGGRLVTDGAVSVSGAVVAGLSGDGAAGPSRLGAGAVRIGYDACAVARAGRRSAVAAQVPGSWTEAFGPWAP